MKMILSLILAVSTALAFAGSEPEGWQVNFKDAVKVAREKNKKILINFTGSDWCPWCKKLKKEVFDQPAFIQFAKDHLVLAEVDFPRSKPQSPTIKKQNEDLQKKYGVEGFPTLILLAPPEGKSQEPKEVARHVGLMAGGLDGLMSWIRRVPSGKVKGS